MRIGENWKPITSNSETRTLLFVVDFVTGSPDVLDFACELSERQNAHLQLLHVVDPERTYSSPDGQMGAQFSLEMLAKRARALKKSTVSLLSFGSPEKEIPRRAAEVNASLVVFPLNGATTDRLQKKLVRRLRGKCDCPVLAVPSNIFLDGDADSASILGLLSLVQQVWEESGEPLRGLLQASSMTQSKAPLEFTPKSARF